MKVNKKQKKLKRDFIEINFNRKVPLSEILALLDKQALFVRRWQMIGVDEFKAGKTKQAEEKFAQLWKQGLRKKLWHPQVISALFDAKILVGNIILSQSGKKLAELKFSKDIGGQFLRKLTGNRKIALQIVTIGKKIMRETGKLGEKRRIEDQFFMHGLAADITEALAKWSNKKIAAKAAWKKTHRLSPGYPIWPDLKEQKKIFALLRPERIGIKLTENYLMNPEYSTSAIIFEAE